ncbi:ABC transporter substrate-binding protein [Cellulomonas dongxiuzhuiae]|uniref:ABC transporter substrate-binding protein n=1 Tax=Cellulomonas dongxiuzhuiae TaxID=2819979 RepID=UPI001AAEDD02|nr:ABC transporter substrate-binding protein [Cellulomonas dongxiuzhuiae]MBO3089198.1 ABC transporter substrate-binding protein [Cellulomonas dongxiuzhuiae]
MSSRLTRPGALGTAGLFLVAAALAACSGGSPEGAAAGPGTSEEDDLPVVRFQAFPADPAGVPVVVIQEMGLDEKHGFRAEVVEVDPDAAATNLLIGGADVAVEQDGVTMTLAQAQGYDTVVFYPSLNTMMSMVVREDSPYQTPEDLVGLKVGHFGVDSGTTTVIALMLKELYGIDFFTDYDLREAGPAALPELLASGEVEAIVDYEPLALRAVLDAPGRYVFEPAKAWADVNEGWSPYLTNLAASRAWLEENSETAKGVLAAWKEAVAEIEATDYELFAQEPYKEWIAAGSDEELEAFITYCADLPCYLDDFTQDDVEQLDDWLALMAENDLLIEEVAEQPIAVILEELLP